MKKLFTIITLLMSSFFLFSLKEVRAETIELEIPESDFSYINDNFFELREKTIEYCEINNCYYFIRSQGGDLISSYITSNGYSVDSIGYAKNLPSIKFNSGYFYKLIDGVLTKYSDFNASTNAQLFTSKLNFSLLYFLDTNIPVTNTLSTYSYVFKYNDLSYEINQNDKIPTLYQVYLDSTVEVDKFEEEKEIMNNFYSTIFTKISDLVTSLSNDYTFLVIFGIMILIFIIELIRRYLI